MNMILTFIIRTKKKRKSNFWSFAQLLNTSMRINWHARNAFIHVWLVYHTNMINVFNVNRNEEYLILMVFFFFLKWVWHLTKIDILYTYYLLLNTLQIPGVIPSLLLQLLSSFHLSPPLLSLSPPPPLRHPALNPLIHNCPFNFLPYFPPHSNSFISTSTIFSLLTSYSLHYSSLFFPNSFFFISLHHPPYQLF